MPVISGRIAACSPDRLFAILAMVTGLILAIIIPPLAGGNERLNFQRASTIAAGHFLIRPAEMPGGIVDLLELNKRTFPEGRTPPYSYSSAEFREAVSIRLQTDKPAIVTPNPIAVLHPLSYLPQLLAIAPGLQLGATPLVLSYLGRLFGLVAGVGLTMLAIRIVPVQKFGLAAIALLPPVMYSRATLDADQFTNGLAFLFIAMVCKAAAAAGRLKRSSLTALAATAFVLAQCKSAYLLIPTISLIIPASRFGSTRSKIFWVAIIILPGALASFAWMLMLKASYFHDLRYRTWSGVVAPDEQSHFVLAHPFAFAGILLKTVFTTALVPKTMIEFLGVFGPPVALPVLFYPLLALGLGGTIASDASARALVPDWRLRILVAGIVALTLTMVLALLYLQWTQLGGTVIDGFNGRYIFPLAPLILLLLPTRSKSLLDVPASYWLTGVGIASAVGTIWLTWSTYVR